MRGELWRGRLHAAHAIMATGQQSFTCDTTVPPSRIPALQQAITTIARAIASPFPRSVTPGTAICTR